MSTEHPHTRSEELLKLASEIVAAYVSNNPVPVADLPGMIKSVHATLGGLVHHPHHETVSAQKPAISVKRSVMPEYIVCLEDGKKLKMLKRYLRSRYNLSPEDYRAKWGLPADYPMVAPNYAKKRSQLAKNAGFGTQPRRKRAKG